MKNDLNDLKSLIFELIRTNDLDVSNIKSLQQLSLNSGEDNESELSSSVGRYEKVFAEPIPAGRPYYTDGAAPSQPVIVSNDAYDESEIIEDNLSLESMERSMISKALKKHGGRRKEAALELGISERTLYRKIKNYDM